MENRYYPEAESKTAIPYYNEVKSEWAYHDKRLSAESLA